MDRAYEGYETRQLVFDHGLTSVVPPESNRIEPWENDRQMHKNATKFNDYSIDSRDSGGYCLYQRLLSELNTRFGYQNLPTLPL